LSPTSTVPDQRGLGKQIKRFLPRRMFRVLVLGYNAVASAMPYSVKYGIGEQLRRSKLPYKLIEDGDVVVQVGAPRDLLWAGRSRAVHFARLVGRGKVVVMEPDPDNVAALKQFIADNGLGSTMLLYPLGGWSHQGELKFLSSPSHPASNQLADVAQERANRPDLGPVNEVIVPVDTVDSILAQAQVGKPKLVSITTNGAEVPILEGMSKTIAEGCPYISLATSIEKYHTVLDQLGYDYILRDDRGACYRQRPRG